ncbi:hypothetical protein MZM54_02775 [[Brevibacterium] frigoritolerans]|nr:hypothetical protein [Peribacillus frigoritolerans]
MKFGNSEKMKRIRKTEKDLAKILDGSVLHCSNKKCKNKVTLNEEEAGRVILCTKCHSGYFVMKDETKNKKESVKEKSFENH